MKLTVLSFAYPYAPVGLGCVGGSEQILTDIDLALVEAGHNSLVIACEGSRPAGKLLSIPRLLRPEDEDARLWCRKQVQACLDRALHTYDVDIVHMHGINFYEYNLPLHIPVLVTLHVAIASYPERIWTSLQPNIQLQCVSQTQRRCCPPELGDVPVIPNGVEIPALTQKSGDFAIVLGRICPEKNQHVALEAGFRAHIPVLLGGQVFPWRDHLAYFQQKIQPLIENPNSVRHKFCGPLLPQRKQSLLAQAKCLLHPTLAPETSSLVAMEALAAGTPVIAYPSGALPEVVEHGVTGYLVDSVESMAEAIGRIDAIRPEVCREAAEQRFSKKRMVRQYFELYEELVEAHSHRRVYA
ncbi:MAG: glycosyltransferase [Acidobacteriaceae bacterium]|nr:glycosyltransferase [Acidobacteriaceae bacterium]